MATYLITQASGVQAGWTIAHLLEGGAKIHAVVRNLNKVPPSLQHPDIKVFQGESVNYDQIFAAAQGCHGVYLGTFLDARIQAKQARTVVDACREAGVKSIVVSTSFGTSHRHLWDTETSALHEYYNSKVEVEDIVRRGNFEAYTILRPAFMHVNYILPQVNDNFPRLHTHGILDHIYNDGARMPHTDANDIGKYAAAALRDPARFNGQEIEFCSESLTIEEARDILAKVSGREIKTQKWTLEGMQKEGIAVPVTGFHMLANETDFSVLVAATKEAEMRFGIPFTSLEAALQRERAQLLECLPAQAA
jgi:uncharacterized protein YbjT (DUF2867 family)